MKMFVIFATMVVTLFSTSQLYALGDCECQVNGPHKYSGSSDAQCSLLYHVANQSSEDCSVITFESGMSGTIKLGSGFPLNSNYLRIVGPVDSNGNPKITLVADNIPTEYFIRLMGTHTNKLPTLENFYIQAPGKKAIYIDGSGHILKNVRISDSKIGVEIGGKTGGNKNQITGAGNKFYNNTEDGIKIIKGDYNYISQAVFYGNGKAITRTKATTDPKDNDFGNSAFTFKRAKDFTVVGLLSSGVKNPVGITGFADKDLDTGVDGLELFEADNQDEKEDMGQGKKYITKKNSSSWAFGMPDDSDANFKRFGVAVTNMTADKYYTATSIADKTDEDETTEFSSTFSAENEMIIGGPACLGTTWYLYAIDGYDKDGDEANCYKMNGQALVGIPCTGDPWTVDSDGDIMPNGMEDKNFNCNPDGKPDTGETDPIVFDKECKLFPTLPKCNDADEDGVPNIKDNCLIDANPDQLNVDEDNFGNVCDKCLNDTENADDLDQNGNPIDSDGDGTPDICDNCPDIFNDQNNADGDDLGDACEEKTAGDDNDWDDDGILNDDDNCPYTPNPGQEDIDKDGVGDVCDNCKNLKNTGQENANGDVEGDVCEGDNDSDGIINDDDNCIDTPNFDQANIDGDIYGDVCDNCADDGNDDQKDSDSDGAGDVCDNCIAAPNSGQDDLDSDAIGDVCDTDMDGDGIPDIDDNCPSVYNIDQADSDADGIGDRCDIDPSISPDIDQEPLPSIFGDIEGGGGHVSSRGGCSSDIGSVAAGGTPNLLVSIVLLGLPTSAIFIRRRFFV